MDRDTKDANTSPTEIISHAALAKSSQASSLTVAKLETYHTIPDLRVLTYWIYLLTIVNRNTAYQTQVHKALSPLTHGKQCTSRSCSTQRNTTPNLEARDHRNKDGGKMMSG